MITLTKAQALKIQADHVAWYSSTFPTRAQNLAARVAAITTAYALEDDVLYDFGTINRHIPRGCAIEQLMGIDLGGD